MLRQLLEHSEFRFATSSLQRNASPVLDRPVVEQFGTQVSQHWRWGATRPVGGGTTSEHAKRPALLSEYERTLTQTTSGSTTCESSHPDLLDP